MVRVTVLEATDTGGHKVKVQGVLIAEEPSPPGELPPDLQHGIWMLDPAGTHMQRG